MKKKIASILLAFGLVVCFGFTNQVGSENPTDKNPDKLIAEIDKFRTETIAKARESGNLDVQAMDRAIKQMALDAVKGVDAHKVELRMGLSWAKLYNLAEMDEEVMICAERFISSGPPQNKRFEAELLIFSALDRLVRMEELFDRLKATEITNGSQASQFALTVAYTYAERIREALGAKSALELLDITEKKTLVDSYFENMTSNASNPKDLMLRALAETRADIYMQMGQKSNALEAINKALSKMNTENNPLAARLESKKTLINMVGAPAPEVKFDRVIGEFKGLSAYRGKYVILDFFAHWCGPCIRAFPEMIDLYKELHSKGVEIFSLTRFYGYYKLERNISQDLEFSKVMEFKNEHNLPWPIVYVDSQAYKDYAVNAIPHFVLIDPDGKVMKVQIGFRAGEFIQLKAELSKLLNSK